MYCISADLSNAMCDGVCIVSVQTSLMLCVMGYCISTDPSNAMCDGVCISADLSNAMCDGVLYQYRPL